LPLLLLRRSLRLLKVQSFWFMEVEERVPALENELEKEHQR
jgi:hypothetical protein